MCDSTDSRMILLFTETPTTSTGTINYFYFNRSLGTRVLQDVRLFVVVIFRVIFIIKYCKFKVTAVLTFIAVMR